MAVRRLERTVMELPGGGYVIGDGTGDDIIPRRAVSSITEACGAVFSIVEERFQPETDDDPIDMPRVLEPSNVVRPKRFFDRIMGR